MMKGYILEAYNDMKNSHVSSRLMEEAAKRGIDLSIIGIHDTIICDGEAFNSGKKVENCDFVINRYKWGKTKDFLNSLAQKSYNALEPFQIYVNKYEQISKLHSEYFEKPGYILGDSGMNYENLANVLGSKMVAKGLENSMGREIFLIESESDMEGLRAYGNHKEWLFEEFIHSSYGRDLRVYAIRGRVAACIMRKAESDFRANVALGAVTTEYEITEEIREIARDIYLQTGLDFVGIDLLFGEKKPVFCEINVMAGFQGVEEATGVNIAGKIMDTICEDLKVE